MSEPGHTLLFKFGELPHLEALQRGQIYMQPWSYFRDCENTVERDLNEGTHVWANPRESVITIGGHVLSAEGGTLNASISFQDRVTKIFCASTLQKSMDRNPGPILDDRVKKHGKNLLVIWNLDHFFEKLQRAIMALKDKSVLTGAHAQSVEYFDEATYDGPVGPFRKSSRYSIEKEWRLAVQKTTEDDQAFQFDIEAIADHSKIIPTESFINRIEVRSDGSLQINV